MISLVWIHPPLVTNHFEPRIEILIHPLHRFGVSFSLCPVYTNDQIPVRCTHDLRPHPQDTDATSRRTPTGYRADCPRHGIPVHRRRPVVSRITFRTFGYCGLEIHGTSATTTCAYTQPMSINHLAHVLHVDRGTTLEKMWRQVDTMILVNRRPGQNTPIPPR